MSAAAVSDAVAGSLLESRSVSLPHSSSSSSVSRPRRLASDALFCILLMVTTSLLAYNRAIPVYVNMMILTVAIVYLGCQLALTNSLSPTAGQSMETMSSSDVKRFPIVGSIVLFSLYLLFKFGPKEWINFFIRGFFFCIGVLVLGQRISWLLEGILPSGLAKSLIAVQWKGKIPSFEIPLPNIEIPIISKIFADSPEEAAKKAKRAAELAEEKVEISLLDGLSMAASAVLGYFYLTTNHWLLSNLFGICFCLQGIESIGLGSYFNGVILLSGLFFYDIFWVFGTEVMVTVAKNFDAPAVLFFPPMDDGRPSMLGLGDIVIPGIFIALVRRFDYARAQQSGTNSAPYFNITLFAYFLGLSATVGVMYYFLAAQPALLYLVPACLGASMLTAAVKGEFNLLWNYTEGEEEKEKEKDNKKPKKQ